MMKGLLSKARTFLEECSHAGCDLNTAAELTSDTCISHFVIGKRSSQKELLSHTKDWFDMFPDFKTEVLHIEQQGNLIISNTLQTATFLNKYRMSLAYSRPITELCKSLMQTKPNGARIKHYSTFYIFFEKGLISRILLNEDPTSFYKQLGLAFPRKTDDSEEDLRSLKDRFNEMIGSQFSKREIELLGLSSCGFKPLLSRREIESLALFFCGLSAKYIGELQKISYRTVETYLQHTYKKLGCTGKHDVLDMMHSKGLLSLLWEIGQLTYKMATRQNR